MAATGCFDKLHAGGNHFREFRAFDGLGRILGGDGAAPGSTLPDPTQVARDLLALAAQHPDPLPLLEVARLLLEQDEGDGDDDGVAELRVVG